MRIRETAQRGPGKTVRVRPLAATEERQLFRHLKRGAGSVGQPGQGRLPAKRRRPPRPLDRGATAIRNRIALSNLRLVVSVAKRFASPQQSVEDLVSEASILLLRCVERFDAGRGTRFSTYATRALTHHFVRLRNCASGGGPCTRCRGCLRTGCRFRRGPKPAAAPVRREELKRLDQQLAALPGRERALLAARFGLNQQDQPQTFRELAAAHGLSKEWARVTTAGVLARLRLSLDPTLAHECPG